MTYHSHLQLKEWHNTFNLTKSLRVKVHDGHAVLMDGPVELCRVPLLALKPLIFHIEEAVRESNPHAFIPPPTEDVFVVAWKRSNWLSRLWTNTIRRLFPEKDHFNRDDMKRFYCHPNNWLKD